ncbi:MAG: sulfide dehydrogenase, partial [Pseudomonadota bacterium]
EAASPAWRAFEAAPLAPRIAERVEWRRAGRGGRVLAIDAPSGVIETEAGLIRADVVNFIPAQSAGAIAWEAGLVDSSGWCPCALGGRSIIRPQALIAGDAARRADRTAAAAAAAGRRAAETLLAL